MTDRRRLLRRLAPPAVVAATLLAGHALPLPESGRYAAYLIAFSIWMAWFVRVVAGLLRDPER